MTATLWDGTKQLHGKLELNQYSLKFAMVDFPNSSLNLEIQYSEIKNIRLYLVYNIELQGLEILTKDGGQNIFIAQDAEHLKNSIEKRFRSLT